MSLISFILFCFAASLTPGPANLAIFSISGSQPLDKSIRFIAGICCGLLAVLLLALLPVFGVFFIQDDSGIVQLILQCAGAVYLLYFSYQIFKNQSMETCSEAGFFHGLWIHPLSAKAWFFVMSAYTMFIEGRETLLSLLPLINYIIIFFLSAIFSHTLWCIFGIVVMSRLSASYQKRLNQALALLLAAVVIYTLASNFLVNRIVG